MGEVTLRTIELGDTDNIVKWRNVDSVKKYLYTQDELTAEQHIAYYERCVKSGKCAQFIISVRDDERYKDIGTVFIKNIDHKNHSGEYGIFIGEESARGRGYGKEATKLILRYAFGELKLHRIFLTVMCDNLQAISAYEKSGFVMEGIMREEYLRSDGYIDIIIMSILKDEWEEREAAALRTRSS